MASRKSRGSRSRTLEDHPRVLTSRGRTTRNALLLAAREVFGRDGFYEARLVDITAAGGVAIGSFYTYFDSKEEIFREVASMVLEEIAVAPRRDPDNTEGDPVRDIAFATRQYLLAISRNAGVARSIQQVISDDPAVRESRQVLIARGVERGARYIERLQKRGIADPTVEPRPTAAALQSMVISVAYDNFVLSETGEDINHLVNILTRIWVRAVGIPH